jgi:hypothetical protein
VMESSPLSRSQIAASESTKGYEESKEDMNLLGQRMAR